MLRETKREAIKAVPNGAYKARVLHYEDSPECLTITFQLEGVTYKHHPARIRLTNGIAYETVTFYDRFFEDVVNQLRVNTEDDAEILELMKTRAITLYATQNGPYTNYSTYKSKAYRAWEAMEELEAKIAKLEEE